MPAPSHLSTLAAPDAAPVSQETRLKYVLKHFWLIYEPASEVRIGYANTQPEVLVADVADGFFQQAKPYPPAPNFREWAGARVPFFFDDAPEAPLLALGIGRATIHADIVAAAFFLLSGWQEYFSDTRDRHGRFTYAASVQQQYGFVALPVVNYYFDVLKTAVEHVIGQPLRLRPWREGAPLAAFISHDIDNLRSAWKAPAKTALKRGQLLKFGRMMWQHLTQADAWDNLEAVADATAQYGAKSTFFVLPAHQPAADGTPNADYELRPLLCTRFQALQRQGHEVAYHGSIGTATDASWLERERHAILLLRDLPSPPGLRFHYLRWDPRNTLQALEKAAVPYDSTLGFAEHYGFRHSYCHPFYPFNFVRGEASTVLEIPLHVMDATLHHPNYLRLTPAEILPALLPVFDEVAKFGGVVSVLWHNENFDPANVVTGPVQFHALMAALQQRGAAFLTGRQITDSFASGC
jgi:peptidoglycan/xylan/chitin deacetylase (PgdA/CDA1 family)